MPLELRIFDPLDNFYKLLPNKPYCGDSKKVKYIMPKEQAKSLPYIQINYPSIHYLCFDCDSNDAAIRALDVDPAPTLAAISPDSGRGHFLFQLLEPIPRKKQSRATVSLLRDVISGYKKMFEAEKCITTQISLVKNPLCEKWHVIEGYRPFLLSELVESIPEGFRRENNHKTPSRSFNTVPFEKTLLAHSRNCSLFESARLYAYSVVDGCDSYDSLYEAVLKYIEKMNSQEVPKHFPNKGMIQSGELRYIAKSVAGWTWDHRKEFTTNRGAMGLPPIVKTDFQSADQYQRELERRRGLSADWTHNVRRESTRGDIKRAVELCLKYGKPATPENISTLARVSRQTVYNYRDLLPVNTAK